VFVQDAQAMATYDALEALRRSAPQPLQRWLDPLYMTERIAFVGATTGHFASYVSILRLCQLNPWAARATRSFSILQSTASLIDALNDYAPTIISTYPTVAALLADEAARATLVHQPREVWTGGETLTPGVRKWVEKSLNCAVRNSYGASEFLTIGWECGQGHLHANNDWLILEPVDHKGHPVPPGQPSHTTLLTNLVNTVQPLIRYDLGDQITFGRQRCACGSPLPVIEVAGRHDDALTISTSMDDLSLAAAGPDDGARRPRRCSSSSCASLTGTRWNWFAAERRRSDLDDGALPPRVARLGPTARLGSDQTDRQMRRHPCAWPKRQGATRGGGSSRRGFGRSRPPDVGCQFQAVGTLKVCNSADQTRVQHVVGRQHQQAAGCREVA
jgi:hypothetical protein